MIDVSFSHNAEHHRRTERQTDRRHNHANSRSYYVQYYRLKWCRFLDFSVVVSVFSWRHASQLFSDSSSTLASKSKSTESRRRLFCRQHGQQEVDGDILSTSTSTPLWTRFEEHDDRPRVTWRFCVQVRVGNTTYFIGELKLAHSTPRLLTSVPFTASVAAASGALLTVVLIICVAYYHKSRESQRIVRRMKTQMDALEARVANECKEGPVFTGCFLRFDSWGGVELRAVVWPG